MGLVWHKEAGTMTESCWNVCRCEDDARRIETTYEDFHDSCIIEVRLTSGMYVKPMATGRRFSSALTVVFEQEGRTKVRLELHFEGDVGMHYEGVHEGTEWPQIHDANVRFLDGMWYWIDATGFPRTSPDDLGGAWFRGRSLKWRERQ
jgi:hypothetical protein